MSVTISSEEPPYFTLTWQPVSCSKGFTHCWVLTFASEKDRDGYLVDPAHKDFGKLIGPAIAGSILISAVTAAFVANIQTSPAIPQSVKSQARVELAGGVPFISDADLETALKDAGATSSASDAALGAYAAARVDGLRSSLAILAVLAVASLFLAQRIPRKPLMAGGAPT